MNDKFLSLLGMARRGGKLSLGHDAVISSVVKNRSKLLILSSEASPRLQREISHAAAYDGKNIPVLITGYTTAEISAAIGSKASVISVDDEGFASAAQEKYSQLSCRKE